MKKGFNNIGNTCYLNSGLQMLIQNYDFCRIIKNNKNDSQNLLTMSEFINEYYAHNNNPLTPDKIKQMVELKRKMFKGSRQHDSHEFVTTLMEILDDDTKGKINTLFEIEAKTTIKCKRLECLNISTSIEKTPFLILPIKSDSNNLDDCYRDYKVHEKLEDDNLYFCEKCNKKVIASKRLEVTKWSNHLIIQLKRFINNNNNLTKINKDIDIPLEWRHGFKISGAVIHNGGVGGGHYFYISKDMDGVWTEYNDSSTSTISESRAQNYLNKAYLLYYVR